MTTEVFAASLCVVDGAWQEAPDNVAIFTPETGRGTLYLIAEVAGDPDGRDQLAREMIETARRAYAGAVGAISSALTEAVRAANEFFFSHNAALAPEARRIAGLGAVVLRDDNLFIAQGGPGVTYILRDAQLTRYPQDSVWFDPDNDLTTFLTTGAEPLGRRRAYTPDLFHVRLQLGDSILIATRALITLLTDAELVDTLANRHPDDVVAALEDIAGASDLSAIAIRFGESETAPIIAPPRPALDAPSPPALTRPVVATTSPPAEIAAPAPETLPGSEQPRVNVGAAMMGAAAKGTQSIAGIFARVDWGSVSGSIGRGIDAFGRGLARLAAAVIRIFLPGAPQTDGVVKPTPPAPNAQSGWRIAALAFPVILVVLGVAAFFLDQRDRQTRLATQTAQLVQQANGALEQSKSLAGTDKRAALETAQKALALAAQACELNPANPAAPKPRAPQEHCRVSASQAARKAFYDAQDQTDTLNGIAVVFLQAAFATFADPKSNATRILARWPEVLILDRGTQRVYRYLVDEVGSKAAPYGGEGGVVLKAGDKFSDRTVADIMDIFWNDGGRVVALERSGLFLTYDLQTNKWSPRAATDASKWSRATLATGYAGNLYLLEPATNQILKYVPGSDGAWSASTTYFAPGVTADLSNVADVAIDGNVWLLRSNGALLRYAEGKPADFKIRDLETAFAAPSAFYTSPALAALYIADAGNRRIVQIDKVSGKFLRQFRPSGVSADAFNTLKSIAVDETNRRFFIISGNQAYLATIPQ